MKKIIIALALTLLCAAPALANDHDKAAAMLRQQQQATKQLCWDLKQAAKENADCDVQFVTINGIECLLTIGGAECPDGKLYWQYYADGKWRELTGTYVGPVGRTITIEVK
jgi:hypothetical protein